jgi:hypothetical protein
MSSSYHPQTDRHTEIMNRHIIAYLRHYISPLGQDWAKHLANAEFTLNNHTSSTTGYSPFSLINNHHPDTPLTLLHPNVNDKQPIIGQASLTQWLLSRETARAAMRLAQDRMAVSANIHCCNITYNIGDMVYISTKTVTAGTEIAIFKVRWIGSYKILEKRNPVAYKVDIPYEMVVNKVYPVYHVS